jgi:NADH:ubiquinone oxidoreductase subunit C
LIDICGVDNLPKTKIWIFAELIIPPENEDLPKTRFEIVYNLLRLIIPPENEDLPKTRFEIVYNLLRATAKSPNIKVPVTSVKVTNSFAIGSHARH